MCGAGELLTDGGGEEGDGLGVLAVVVHGQVPDARVHVLDEAGVVGGEGELGPLQPRRTLQGMAVLAQQPPAVQELHKVKLDGRE